MDEHAYQLFRIRFLYNLHIYKLRRVRELVENETISKAEYKDITGKNYDEE